MAKKITVLDLFAWCWWLSEGFFCNEYDIVWHIEMDPYACETIKTRIIFHFLKKNNKIIEYQRYLEWSISKEELIEKYNLQREVNSVINETIWEDSYKDIVSNIHKKLWNKKLDLIIWWPPCQSYSNIWRSRDKNRMQWDKRNFLYKFYLQFLREFKPKIFVFENVPWLLSAWKKKYFNDMKKQMWKLWYTIEWSEKVINMSKHWLPQNRKRVIIIWRHSSAKRTDYIQLPESTFNYKVKELLWDLPKLKPGDENKLTNYSKEWKAAKSIGLRTDAIKFTTDHTTRNHRDEDLEIYKIAIQQYNSWKRLKYNELPERLQFHKNKKSFLDRFKVINGEWHSTHTVVAHISKDWHYYIYPSLKQVRSLSVREAARLQTFPDDFKFEWPRTAQYKQIWNAVPPWFAKLLSNVVKEYFI